MKRDGVRRAGGAALVAALLFLLSIPTGALAQTREDPPLTVESLTCRGNSSTSCEFILGHVYLNPGDPLDEREIREASLRLSWLRNFESVSIYLEKGSHRGRAVVVVEVREANPVNYEAGLGLSSRAGDIGGSAAGRATHYNLFGEGKILDAYVSTFGNVEGNHSRAVGGGVEYIDPHLFGTKRNFMILGMGYWNQRSETQENGDRLDAEVLAFRASYGRRLWSFSYITAGFEARPLTDIFSARQQRDGTIEVLTSRNHGGPMASFGWNSEDDAYFPTQGSRLSFGYLRSFAGKDEYNFSFRKNWRFGGKGTWTFGVSPDGALTASYARPFHLEQHFDNVRRARWYATPFFRPLYIEADGTRISEVGLSAGVLLETRSFGIVNLSLYASGTSAGRGD
jgi:outer membrane protein assembly factor BamA